MADTPRDDEQRDQPYPDDREVPADRPPIYSSDELFRGQKEAWIEHGGEMYRLRVTSRGNLILTK